MIEMHEWSLAFANIDWFHQYKEQIDRIPMTSHKPANEQICNPYSFHFVFPCHCHTHICECCGEWKGNWPIPHNFPVHSLKERMTHNLFDSIMSPAFEWILFINRQHAIGGLTFWSNPPMKLRAYPESIGGCTTGCLVILEKIVWSFT